MYCKIYNNYIENTNIKINIWKLTHFLTRRKSDSNFIYNLSERIYINDNSEKKTRYFKVYNK